MIQLIGATHERLIFPCGELHVRVKMQERNVTIVWNFENVVEIMEVLLIHDAIKQDHGKVIALIMPYIPFSRQDRVATPGDCFSLKMFANLINSMNIESVFVSDPHSDVATALINNCWIETQASIFEPVLKDRSNFFLISPDGGALKKIYQLSKRVENLGVIECGKYRDVITGEVTGCSVPETDLTGKDCVIVDDICDGGRTFTELAKVLKERGASKVTLCVTHGFFTKGMKVFNGLVDEIYTKKGRVK